MTSSTLDPQAWDRYWAYGNLHSFSQVHAGNYGGRIAAFWQQTFAALPAGARVLDLATGNGAIALLALEAAEQAQRSVEIHATDLAAIDPVNQLGDPQQRECAQRIHFHPRTPAERLPFENAELALVCSQFGLEYSDLDRSVTEIARVLAPQGELALIIHHTDSNAVRAAHTEASAMDFVLDDARVYLKTRNFLRALADQRPRSDGSLPPKAAKKRQAMDRAIEEIETAAQQSAQPQTLRGPLNYIREVLTLAGRNGPREALGWLDEARQRVEATRQRLRAMQAAACDESAMNGFAERLSAAGITSIRTALLEEADGSVLGWTVRGSLEQRTRHPG